MATFQEMITEMEYQRTRMINALEVYVKDGDFKALYDEVDNAAGMADEAWKTCTEKFYTSSALDHISMTFASFDDEEMEEVGEQEFVEAIAEEASAPFVWQEEA